MQECTPHIQTVQAEHAPATEPACARPVVHGLYLHVPFCFHKCHYCDFYSLVEPKGKPDRQEAFTDALIAELRHAVENHALAVETVFVGGGTPTLLRPPLWAKLLDALEQANITPGLTEFTVEANPETVTPELMATLAAGGIDRVSLGAQSFNVDQLKTLERWHDPQTVPRAVQMVRDAGIDNYNLDMIFAVPGQTLDQLDQDLDAVLDLGPTHLSCYSLIFEPNTPLTQKMKMGRISPVGEDLERAMYERVIERMDAAGFEHYEISNWARRGTGNSDRGSDLPHPPSAIHNPTSINLQSPTPIPQFVCHHNLMYWHNRNWVGLGPSAASHVDGKRWKNEPNLGRYIKHAPVPPTMDHEQLPPKRRIGEQIMLGLRLRQGLELSWVNQNIPPNDPRHETIEELKKINLLEKTGTHLRLTHRGLFLADSVIAKLL